MIDIKWINNFSQNGYGICGRRYAQILIKLGYNVRIVPVPYMEIGDILFEHTKTEVKDPLEVYHAIPTVPKECYYTVTEVRKPPDNQGFNLSRSKMILTQSNFCKDSFSNVVDKEMIHVINFPFFRGVFSPVGQTYEMKLPKEYKYKFYTVARLDVRKNVTMLLKAFAEEFGDNPDVCLIAKIGSDRYCIPKMFYKMELPKNIIWLRDFVFDTASLYRMVDAYITTDCGEGWGAPTTEAMLSGLPTIAPNHSGHLDYMNKDNSYLIDVGPWEKIGYDNEHPERLENLYPDLLAPHLEWKVPKFDDVKKKMRVCYDRFKNKTKEERLNDLKIKRAMKVQEIVSEEHVGKQLKTAIDWYENQYR